jgi:magnesium transporter
MIFVNRLDGGRWNSEEGVGALASAVRGTPCWAGAIAPDAAECDALCDRFGLERLALDDALVPEHPPAFREFDHYVLMIVHAPESSERKATRKVALFLGADFVVSVVRAPLPLLAPLVERLRQHPDHYLRAPERIAQAHLAFMADVFEERVDELIDATEKLDGEAMEGARPDFLERLHKLRRRSSHFARVVRAQRDACQSIARGDVRFFSREILPFLRDAADHMLRVYDLLEAVRDNVLAARDSHLTAMNTQLNVAMRTLTAVATIILPLGLIASIFGMNFDGMPLLKNPAGFWILIGAMAALAAALWGWFKRRSWL